MKKFQSWWFVTTMIGLAAIAGLYALAASLTDSGGAHGRTGAAVAADSSGDGLTFASWAEGYGSIQEMSSASALVVVGRVEGSKQEERQMSGGPLPFTDFEVVVDRTLKGGLAAGAHITVHQTGGIQPDGSTMEIFDDPLFATGSQYLLFLKRDQATGRYFVAGGPEGRFVVDGERVVPLSEVYPDRRIESVPTGGASLGEIAAAVR